MTITHEQKASIGAGYVEEIKSRIKTRSEAQSKAKEKSQTLKDNSKLVRQYAEDVASLHALSGRVAHCEIDDDYDHGQRTYFLKIIMESRIKLIVPVSAVSGLQPKMSEASKAEDLARELCQEIEFLHGSLSPGRVASFQAHVARLWAPKTRDSRITSGELRQFVEDFLVSHRPAVCKVA